MYQYGVTASLHSFFRRFSPWLNKWWSVKPASRMGLPPHRSLVGSLGKIPKECSPSPSKTASPSLSGLPRSNGKTAVARGSTSGGTIPPHRHGSAVTTTQPVARAASSTSRRSLDLAPQPHCLRAVGFLFCYPSQPSCTPSPSSTPPTTVVVILGNSVTARRSQANSVYA